MSLTQFIRRRGNENEAGQPGKQQGGVSPVNTKASQLPLSADGNAVDSAREDKVGQARTIVRREDLPEFTKVLTASGHEAEISKAEQGVVALLAVGEREAVLVWTGRPDDAGTRRFVQRLAVQAGYRVRPERYIAPPDVLRVVHEHGGAGTSAIRHEGEREFAVDDSSTFVRLKKLVAAGVERNASDLHLNVYMGRPTDIYLRVNGRLQLVQQVPEKVGFALARTIHRQGGIGKTGIDLDPRQPQDASVEVRVEAKLEGEPTAVETNNRFGSMPERSGGTTIALRLIVTNNKVRNMTLKELGYPEKQIEVLERAIAVPDGLTIFVGTTGSGKSRTLQTLLGLLRRKFGDTRKISTIEQPVEYVIEGALQSPVDESQGGGKGAKQGTGFAPMLRALMRNDPDFVMVGEIRDRETGSVCKDAVETGHPVFATLHAKDAVSAMHRLMSLGVEREIACSLGFANCIAYQRLAETVCTHCSLSYEQANARDLTDNALRQRILKRVGGEGLRQTRWEHPEGCKHCDFTGVGGRTVCAEFFTPEADELEYLARGKVNHAKKRWRARAADDPDGVQGWTAQDQAVKHMRAGLISPKAVEDSFNLLDAEESPEAAKAWLAKHGDAGYQGAA